MNNPHKKSSVRKDAAPLAFDIFRRKNVRRLLTNIIKSDIINAVLLSPKEELK